MAWLAAALVPATAEAHTALRGVGGFWAGVEHLLTSFDQLGFLLGLAVWTSFGSRGLDTRVIGAIFIAVFAGALLGIVLPGSSESAVAGVSSLLMLAVGLLGAAALRPRMLAPIGVTAAGGMLAGTASGAAAADVSIGLFALGAAIASAAVLSYGVLAARALDAEWGIIARRAAASWIAAVGLMTLAFVCSRGFGRR